MKTYTLLNGKEVDLSELTPFEQDFLQSIRNMVARRASYYQIKRAAIGTHSPASRGGGTYYTLSLCYLVARDFVRRLGIKQGILLDPKYKSERAKLPRDGSYITAGYAAELLCTSRAVVDKAIKDGKLDELRVANLVLVTRESCSRYREERERSLRATFGIDDETSALERKLD